MARSRSTVRAVRLLPLALAFVLFAPTSRAAELDDGTVNTLSRLLTTALADKGAFQVTSSQELKSVIELEGEKQSLGCDAGASSCLAEVANAMGARFVIFGQVGAVDAQLILTLQLFDSTTGANAGRLVVQRASASELVDALPATIDQLIKEGGLLTPPAQGKHHVLVLDLTREPSSGTAPLEPNGALLWTGGASAALGGALAVGAGAFYALALSSQQAAVDEPLQRAAAAHLDARDGNAGIAGALLIGGGVLAVVGGALAGGAYLVGGP